MQHRAPNVEGAGPFVPLEEDLLVAELAYSPGFKIFLERIVRPRVIEIRSLLLRDPALDPAERYGLVLHLLELEKMIAAVYASTEAAEAPAWVQALFR
jgi:hypothetical protein